MNSLHLFLLFLFTLLSLSTSELCHPHDKSVLFKIKQHFNNPYLLASWKTDADCCTDWYQVECDFTTHRIVSLTIFAGNLSGTIPSDVGDLPYLQTLEFHKLTDVYGSIPPAITKLENLKFLRLNWLNLTGEVPAFLGRLRNLNFLDLSFNSLSGTIPSELGALENLNALHLDRNKLTVTIPESFGSFKKGSQTRTL